ncbi:protein eva-1-like [Pectinophora gossypiella]|uniref:protein eva-1-like n=1 Tax=Pectinophora gossypiella TaxID=13191 RepID=UPI00214F4E77|nr:protein eva-1-like [Pectinophora gossypiella]
MMYVTAIVCAFLWLPGPSCTNSDNFALLGGTLKTMQRAACDDEIVALACPTSTTISIQVAQYGKAAPDGHNCIVDRPSSQAIDVEVAGEEKCLWPNSMQYSLLQTVVEACQKKPSCKFSTKPKPGLVDPCPFARKFVEVAYRCRPYEFRSRTACEDDVIQLSCNPFRRVAVFDAQYGRTAYESVTCPQTQGVPDETCMAPHVAETVMQICHGKRRCTITANSKTFGSPCLSDSRTYLKVIYACVPLGVLSEKYESAAEKDEMDGNSDRNDDDDSFDESGEVGEKWSEPNAIPPIADPALQPLPDVDATPPPKSEDPGIKRSVPNVERPSETHSPTSLFYYIGAGLAVFIILIILLVGVRCYIIRKSSRNSKTADMFTTETPNVFNDAVSDIDNDIDVSHISGTFYDPVHPDMILYRDMPGTKGTIRAMRPLSTIYPCAGASMYGNADFLPTSREPQRFKDEENRETLSPKSLGSYSNSQFYYG